MSEELTYLKNMLNDESLTVGKLKAYLKNDNVAKKIPEINCSHFLQGFNDDDVITNEVSRLLSDLVDHNISEELEKTENDFLDKLLKNTYTHFREIITSDPNVDTLPNIISDYSKESTADLRYSVLYPKLPRERFSFGMMNVELIVNDSDKISFVTNGVKKSAVYKIALRFTPAEAKKLTNVKFANDQLRTQKLKENNTLEKTIETTTVNFHNNFINIDWNSLFAFIGMPYILRPNVEIEYDNTNNFAIVHINTKPFFESLINVFNQYYTTTKNSKNQSLIDIKGFGACYNDINGLILVPEIFVRSMYCVDGNISYPFIYGENKAVPNVEIIQKTYRFTIDCSGMITDSLKEKIGNFIHALSAASGLSLNSSIITKKNNSDSQTVVIEIENYGQRMGDGTLSQISENLNIEDRICQALRDVAQQGLIAKGDYKTGKSIPSMIGTEYYIFVDEDKPVQYLAHLAKIYFNRSSFVTQSKEKSDSKYTIDVIKNNIDQRNNIKSRKTNEMLDTLFSNNGKFPFNGRLYDTSYYDWIPTNIIPISYKKGNDVIPSITFVPFGFTRYTNLTDINDSGNAFYGADILSSEVTVNRVLEITNRGTEIANIKQVVVKSNYYPNFNPNKSQPLKIFQIDERHYVCLFKVIDCDFELSIHDDDWFSSDYNEIIRLVGSNSSPKSISTNKHNLMLYYPQKLVISQSRIIRYIIENINSDHSFIDSILAYESEFAEELTISDLIQKINNGSIVVHDIPLRFFELLEYAANNGSEITPSLLELVASDVFNQSMNYDLTTDTVGKVVGDIVDRIIESNGAENVALDVIDSLIDNVTNKEDVIFGQKINNIVDIYPWLPIMKTFFRSIQKPIRNKLTPEYDLTFESLIIAEIQRFKGMISSLQNKNSKSPHVLDPTSKVGIERFIITNLNSFIDAGVTKSDAVTMVVKIFDEFIDDLLKLRIFFGKTISLDIIRYASTELHYEVFNQFIKILIEHLNVDSFKDDISKILKEKYPRNEFAVIQNSIARYTISTNYNGELDLINDQKLGDCGFVMKVKNIGNDIFSFDSRLFNPNIHCMFSVEYYGKLNIKDIITQTFNDENIFYSLAGSHKKISNVGIVSIYGAPEIVDGMTVLKFFVPFNHDKGRLCIKTPSWTTYDCNFKIINQTLEVEMGFNSIIFDYEYVDEAGVTHSIPSLVKSAIDKFANYKMIAVNPSDISFLYSFIIGLSRINLSYDRATINSYYIFAKDLNPKLTTGKYMNDDETMGSQFWSEINQYIDPDVKEYIFTIKLLPVTPAIVKYYCKINISDRKTKENKSMLQVTANLHYFITTLGKDILGSTVKRSKVIEYGTQFIEGIDKYFDELNSLSDISDVETMIIKNKRGVYTCEYDDINTERKRASFDTIYINNFNNLPSDKIVKLTDIDTIAINDVVKIEEEKRMRNNTIHNLLIATKNVKWDFLMIESYKFYRDDEAKWIKFSPDNNFMGIGFTCGVKIYIRTGDTYTFCTNLSHEGVSDIFFGNKQFCITVQYDDSSRPFGILWVTALGVKIDSIRIKYYKPSVGDYVIGKYNLDGNLRDTKPGELTMSGNNYKVMDKDVKVFNTVYDYNIYFFSEDDRYLIVNNKCTFIVYDLQDFSIVKFKSLNGAAIDDVDIGKKFYAIHSGEWNKNIFVGFSLITLTGEKNMIVINMNNLSISHLLVSIEKPLQNQIKNIFVEKTSDIHPLYSYLMKIRSNSENRIGIWLYDVFLTYFTAGGISYIQYINKSGMQMTTQTSFDFTEASDDEIYMFLKKELCKVTIKMIGNSIKKISFYGIVYYDINELEEPIDDYKPYCIKDQYFTFKDDSIYIWSFSEEDTSITHINNEGYEKFSIPKEIVIKSIKNDERLSFYRNTTIIITDKFEFGVVYDEKLHTSYVDINDNVVYDKKTGEYSNVVINHDKIYNGSFLVSTKVVSEKYTNDSKVISLESDERPISGCMCLNRYPDYKTREIATNKKFITHGNLAIIFDDRSLRIVPKSVQIPIDKDGATLEWYKEIEGLNIQNEIMRIKDYIAMIKTVIPSIGARPTIAPFLEKLYKNLSGKPDDMIVDSINASVVLGIINQSQKEILTTIYSLCGKVSIFSKPEIAVSLLNKFWTTKDSVIFNAMENNYPGRDKFELYDTLCQNLSIIYGNIFVPSRVQRAFQIIREHKTFTVNKVERVRSIQGMIAILDATELTTLNSIDIEAIQIVRRILEIPTSKVNCVQIASLELFMGRIHFIESEMTRMEKLSMVSNFEKYRIPEKNNLIKDFKDVLIYRTALSKCTYPSADYDFVISLSGNFEYFSYGPQIDIENGLFPSDTLKFNKNGEYEDPIDGTVEHPYRYIAIDEFVFDPENVNYSLNAVYKGRVTRISMYAYNLQRIRMIYEYLVEFIFGKQMLTYLTIELKKTNFTNTDILLSLGYYDKKHKYSDFENTLYNHFKNNNLYLKNISEIIDVDPKMFNTVKETIISDILAIVGSPMGASGDIMKNILLSIISIRIPNYVQNMEFDEQDFFIDVLSIYNKKEDIVDPRLKLYNLPYLNDRYNFLLNLITKKRIIPNGIYNERYHEIENAFIPYLWKYRNGVCDDHNIPVLSINLYFDNDIMIPKNHNNEMYRETAPLKILYKIKENERRFGKEYGEITLDINQIVDTIIKQQNSYDSTEELSGVITNICDNLMTAEFSKILTEDQIYQIIKSLPDIMYRETALINILHKVREKIRSFNKKYSEITLDINKIVDTIIEEQNSYDSTEDLSGLIKNIYDNLMKTEISKMLTEEQMSEIYQIIKLPEVYNDLFNQVYNKMILYVSDINEQKLIRRRNLKNNLHTIPCVNLLPMSIEYIFDHIIDGVNFGFGYTRMSHVASKLVHKSNNILSIDDKHEYRPISQVGTRYLTAHELKNNGSTCILYSRKLNTNVIVTFGDCTFKMDKRVYTVGYVSLLDVATITVHNYVMDIYVNGRSYDATIGNLQYKDGQIIFEYKYVDQRYDNLSKRHIADPKSELMKFDSIDDLINKDLFKSYTDTNFSTESIASSNISNINIKTTDGITVIFYKYKNDNFGASGSIVEVYNSTKGMDRIKYWVFPKLLIENIGVDKNKLLILGTVSTLFNDDKKRINGHIIKIGEMFFENHPSPKSIIISGFDREIVVNNSFIKESNGITNSFIHIGLTSYVSFNCEHAKISELFIIKKSQHMEKKFIENLITNMYVSKADGYVSLYFGSSGVSEIWNSNFEFVEIIEGECSWM